MANPIGPTFGAELAAAGCAEGVSWDCVSGELYGDVTDAVRAVLAAHDPTKTLPPTVSGDAIVGILSKSQAAACDVRDLARIAWRDDVPATNNKLIRIAAATGTTPDALRQAAQGG